MCPVFYSFLFYVKIRIKELISENYSEHLNSKLHNQKYFLNILNSNMKTLFLMTTDI